eukprot:TRINITY_DN12371_c0_g3_i2.p4 TRINITY_DN12371_c0_g3~~TRINITY_DN12371_c0_g3_i2.p4  ORF type:complete len:165 (-),score=5.49 TRINITY_DN12371_c0_g3_i2:135-629(-)
MLSIPSKQITEKLVRKKQFVLFFVTNKYFLQVFLWGKCGFAILGVNGQLQRRVLLQFLLVYVIILACIDYDKVSNIIFYFVGMIGSFSSEKQIRLETRLFRLEFQVAIAECIFSLAESTAIVYGITFWCSMHNAGCINSCIQLIVVKRFMIELFTQHFLFFKKQ